MLIGLAGDPLKKKPGLLKQDSTRTAQDSQRGTFCAPWVIGIVRDWFEKRAILT